MPARLIYQMPAWQAPQVGAPPEVERVSNLVSFEPNLIDVFLDDRKLALEPGQGVKEHGVDRNLDPGEILKRTHGPVSLG